MIVKILELTLKKKWFSMIVSGEKKEEYRETKQYWITRLCERIDENNLEIKRFTHARFKNGYSKNAPTHIREITSIVIGCGKPEWGANENENVFVIKLGETAELTKNFAMPGSEIMSAQEQNENQFVGYKTEASK